MEKKESFDEYKILSWCIQICSAIEYMHAAKIYHRDLKPQNILVFKAGSLLKLADFGTAKYMGNDKEEDMKTFTGTPGFMAPEVTKLQNKYDGKADLFSVGVMMYSFIMTRDRPQI